MRPGQQQNKQRMRGRGRKGPNPLSRSYESNGPDVKIRGTAQHIAEKYLTLARDASASGDRVMAENYLQHAEHYGRIVAAAQGSFQVQRDEREVEYDEDGEEIFDESAENRSQADAPQPQPQMRETRDNQPREPRENGARDGGQPRDNYQRENRENRGNRDGNREFQPRENRGERDGNREQNRDGQREFQPRENRGENRENRGNRDGNREFQPRENRGERSREFRENRGEQGERAAQAPAAVPSGLGPQPFIGLPPAAPSFEAQPQQPEHLIEAQPAPVPAVSNAEVQADLPVRAEGEPRRRGRPRRVRAEESESASAEAVSAEPAVAPAPVETPAADVEASAPIAGDAPEGEVKAKRRPGRPRKKKVEDEGPDDGGEHLPAFLMASNG